MIGNEVAVRKYLYAYKNKVAGVYYQAFVSEHNPDITTKQIIRTVQLDNEASKNLRHLELWCLGYYDDNVGDLEPEKQYLIDIDEVLAQFLKVSKEEVVNDEVK